MDLAIITNAGGPGVMAVDAFAKWRAEPTALSADTIGKLDEVLPPHWSRNNPVDVLGDAPPERSSRRDGCWLAPPEDAPALAQAIKDALADPAEARRRALAGRDLVEDQFNSRKNYARLKDYIEESP